MYTIHGTYQLTKRISHNHKFGAFPGVASEQRSWPVTNVRMIVAAGPGAGKRWLSNARSNYQDLKSESPNDFREETPALKTTTPVEASTLNEDRQQDGPQTPEPERQLKQKLDVPWDFDSEVAAARDSILIDREPSFQVSAFLLQVAIHCLLPLVIPFYLLFLGKQAAINQLLWYSRSETPPVLAVNLRRTWLGVSMAFITNVSFFALTVSQLTRPIEARCHGERAQHSELLVHLVCGRATLSANSFGRMSWSSTPCCSCGRL